MWVGVFNPDPQRTLAVDVKFYGQPGRQWSTVLTLQPLERNAVNVATVIPVPPGGAENVATEVVFPPGRVGIVSFALWHNPNYGNDRVVDLSPTFLCRVPTSD